MSQKLRGFVGQGMAAKKKTPVVSIIKLIDTSTTNSFAAPIGCTAFVGLWGAGQDGISPTIGGAGADAVFQKIPLQAGWTLSWSIGAHGSSGGDTTLTWPAGLIRARGGASSSANLGAYASSGGLGGNGAAGSNGADGGGTGGTSGATGGGGGAAGLASKFPGFTQGGNGGNGINAQTTGGAPGGGGGGDGGATGPGAGGRILILLMRQSAA